MSKILLVEDNEMNRDMLTRRLERKGYDEQKALQAGCDDYDTKPIDLKRLLGKIGNLLGTP